MKKIIIFLGFRNVDILKLFDVFVYVVFLFIVLFVYNCLIDKLFGYVWLDFLLFQWLREKLVVVGFVFQFYYVSELFEKFFVIVYKRILFCIRSGFGYVIFDFQGWVNGEQ